MTQHHDFKHLPSLDKKDGQNQATHKGMQEVGAVLLIYVSKLDKNQNKQEIDIVEKLFEKAAQKIQSIQHPIQLNEELIMLYATVKQAVVKLKSVSAMHFDESGQLLKLLNDCNDKLLEIRGQIDMKQFDSIEKTKDGKEYITHYYDSRKIRNEIGNICVDIVKKVLSENQVQDLDLMKRLQTKIEIIAKDPLIAQRYDLIKPIQDCFKENEIQKAQWLRPIIDNIYDLLFRVLNASPDELAKMRRDVSVENMKEEDISRKVDGKIKQYDSKSEKKTSKETNFTSVMFQPSVIATHPDVQVLRGFRKDVQDVFHASLKQDKHMKLGRL